MTHPIVTVRDLSHRYTRDWAIKGLTFDVPGSGILGLLGSNGAGKSTFMNILCGVLHPTVGEVIVNGINLRSEPLRARNQIGFLPQQAPLYTELTVDEYLRFCAKLRKIGSKEEKRLVGEAKDLCGIAHFSNRLIRNLSGGYRQRVGIAQAILHKPKIVVLDEPTNGLDPNQIIVVRELIREIAKRNSVILSTHVLSEVQALCSQIIMIELGEIVFSGSLQRFNDQVTPASLSMTAENLPHVDDVLKIDGVSKVEQTAPSSLRVWFEGSRDVANRIVAASVADGWNLLEIRFERSSLDDVFAKLSQSDRRPSVQSG